MKEENNNQISSLSDNRKITIINVAMLTLVGTNFRPQIGKIQSWGETEEEQAFTKKVFDVIQESTKDVKIDAEFKRKLKKDLYEQFGVSKEGQKKEVEKRVKMAESAQEHIEKQRTEWAKQDAQTAQKLNGVFQSQESNRGLQSQELNRELQPQECKTIDIIQAKREREHREEYKRWLYKPHLIATTNNKVKKEMPLIKLNKRKPEDIVDYEYEFAGTQYTIRRTGELLYKTFVGVEDSISEYEITMRREGKVLTVRKFGNISIPTMEYEGYSREVFTTLLGKNNMEDPELHSYMGSLEEVNGPTREIQPYKIAHSAEEYTAVMLWEELERRQTKNAKLKQNRAAGGDGAR